MKIKTTDTFVYKVDHAHEISGCVDVKFIGVFSTRSRALKVVKNLSVQPGFKRYKKLIDPLKDDAEDGFYIDKIPINHVSWEEGFITWREALPSPRKK